jgi:hypothetical protein
MADFERLLPNGSESDNLLSFHEDYWGNALPDTLKTCIDQDGGVQNGGVHAQDDDAQEYDENDSDLLPEQSNPFIRSKLRTLLIRSEYLRIYNFVEKVYEEEQGQVPPAAVIITGQPGAGECSVTTDTFIF